MFSQLTELDDVAMLIFIKVFHFNNLKELYENLSSKILQ